MNIFPPTVVTKCALNDIVRIYEQLSSYRLAFIVYLSCINIMKSNFCSISIFMTNCRK